MEQRREEARFGLLAVELAVEIGGSQNMRESDRESRPGPITVSGNNRNRVTSLTYIGTTLANVHRAHVQGGV